MVVILASFKIKAEKWPKKIKQFIQYAVKNVFIASKYMYFYSALQKDFNWYDPGLP